MKKYILFTLFVVILVLSLAWLFVYARVIFWVSILPSILVTWMMYEWYILYPEFDEAVEAMLEDCT